MVPINYIMLLMFTLCEAYLVASVAAVSDPEAVICAAFSTAAIVLAIMVFSWFNKVDFTYFAPIIIVVAMSMCMLSIFIFAFHFRALKVVYCTLGVIIFSLYLLVDTQLIMGGNRYSVGIDDYILGALILYSDIIMIFLYLLRLFGGR